MQTTTVDYVETVCGRCAGKGYLSHYQHFKGGECFSCGTTGKGQPKPIEREMTYAEMVSALETQGINIVRIQHGDDWLESLFVSDDEITGARMLLQSL